jgi:hypothetical protein
MNLDDEESLRFFAAPSFRSGLRLRMTIKIVKHPLRHHVCLKVKLFDIIDQY